MLGIVGCIDRNIEVFGLTVARIKDVALVSNKVQHLLCMSSLDVEVKIGSFVVGPIKELQRGRARYERSRPILQTSESVYLIFRKVARQQLPNVVRNSTESLYAVVCCTTSKGEISEIHRRKTREYHIVGRAQAVDCVRRVCDFELQPYQM